jgi:hypothetical protein
MMGPIDPMQYSPTWQLLIIIILIFGAIYGCGRILEYLLRQFIRCMKYLLLQIIDLLYGDDFEENAAATTFEDNAKRRKREATRRIKNENANNNTSSKSVLLNTQSNGTIERTTVPVETTIPEGSTTELEVEVENDNEIAEAMRHSPTDDEGKFVLDGSQILFYDNFLEKSKNSSSSVSPAIRHRHGENVKHSEHIETSTVTVVSSSS